MTPSPSDRHFWVVKLVRNPLGRFTYQRGKERVPNHTFSNVNSVEKGMLGHREDQQAFSQTKFSRLPWSSTTFKDIFTYYALTEHKDCQIITLRCNCLVHVL